MLKLLLHSKLIWLYIDVKNLSVDLGRIRNMFKSNAGFPVALETIFPDTYKQGRKSLC